MARAGDEWIEVATRSGSTVKVLKASHSRATRLRLTVTPAGARLSCPRGTHPAQVTAFLQQQADWLATKVKEMHVRAPPAPLRPGMATRLPLRGSEVRLEWVEAEQPTIWLDGDTLTVALPRPWTRAEVVARNLLRDFLESQVRRDLNRWMAKYVPEIGRAPTSIRIRNVKSLWGSLDGRDHVTLDLALALAPRTALQYVFVHELCHLRVRDHSPRFWRLVGELLPDYQVQRDWLRTNGPVLKREIERLVGARRLSASA